MADSHPAWATYYAIDDDTYDGAEDSRTRSHIGYGHTAEEAIADWHENYGPGDDLGDDPLGDWHGRNQ